MLFNSWLRITFSEFREVEGQVDFQGTSEYGMLKAGTDCVAFPRHCFCWTVRDSFYCNRLARSLESCIMRSSSLSICSSSLPSGGLWDVLSVFKGVFVHYCPLQHTHMIEHFSVHAYTTTPSCHVALDALTEYCVQNWWVLFLHGAVVVFKNVPQCEIGTDVLFSPHVIT